MNETQASVLTDALRKREYTLGISDIDHYNNLIVVWMNSPRKRPKKIQKTTPPPRFKRNLAGDELQLRHQIHRNKSEWLLDEMDSWTSGTDHSELYSVRICRHFTVHVASFLKFGIIL